MILLLFSSILLAHRRIFSRALPVANMKSMLLFVVEAIFSKGILSLFVFSSCVRSVTSMFGWDFTDEPDDEQPVIVDCIED